MCIYYLLFIESKLPFLTKLSFSKWSDIRQQSTGSSNLLLSSVTPCMSRLLHNSECAVSKAEFPVARTTQQMTSPGGIPWTLWELKDFVMEAVDHVAGNLVRPRDASRNEMHVTHVRP